MRKNSLKHRGKTRKAKAMVVRNSSTCFYKDWNDNGKTEEKKRKTLPRLFAFSFTSLLPPSLSLSLPVLLALPFSSEKT